MALTLDVAPHRDVAPLTPRRASRRRPHGWRLLRTAVVVVICVALVLYARTIHWHATWLQVAGADRTLLMIALIVNLLSLAGKAVLWWIFLRAVGAVSFPTALKATFAGAGLNNVLVANGGDAARVLFVTSAGNLRGAVVLATVALERMFEALGYVVLLVLSASLLQLPPVLARTRPIAWLALGGVAVFMTYLVRRTARPEPVAESRPGWRARLAYFMRRFTETISGVATGPRFVAALALSMATWALQLWSYALTARAVHFEISSTGTVAAFLAVNLGYVLRATPGNVGVFQATYALIATGFGMDRDQAIAVALLVQAQQLIPVTLIGAALAPGFLFRGTPLVHTRRRTAA